MPQALDSLDAYLDLVKEKHGLTSERALSRLLEITPTTLQGWRRGHYWPNDDSMKKIAELAEQDPHLAEVELQIWNNDGPAKQVWIEIAERLASAAAVLAFLALFTPAPTLAQVVNKVTSAPDGLYIMENSACCLIAMR